MPNPFEQLYLDHRGDLYAFLYSCTREEQTASDLVQDAYVNFMRAFESRPLPPDLECRKYLFRVARNLVINWSRASYQKKVQLADELHFASGHSGPEEQVLNQMGDEEARRVLETALTVLSLEERTVIVLRYQLGLKLEEIADIMEVSISRTSRLIEKTLRKLKAEALKQGLRFEA
ncbi:MAG: sigma-70 family RNA polymerase sigma factor [Spirochaetales bacterium]|nr:sigma-70 family RNA polymerase sigma factor [Spirochaetales bacterium]